MQPNEKFRSDLDQALRRSGGASEPMKLESLRAYFLGFFRKSVPEETLADLFATFQEKWRRDEDKALAWLGGVGSVLLQDYDGTPLSKEDWAGLRESVSLDQGSIDLDLLSYVMTLVVDHGAL